MRRRVRIAVVAAIAVAVVVLLLLVVTSGGPSETRVRMASSEPAAPRAPIRIEPIAPPAPPVVAPAPVRVPLARARVPMSPPPPHVTVAPPTPAVVVPGAPSASDVARQYAAVGRKLKALDAAKGMDATLDLWPRYRWVRIADWLATPTLRSEVTAVLDALDRDITTAAQR